MAKRNCSYPGCPNPHNAHGWCQTHGKRVAKTGSPEPPPDVCRKGHLLTPDNVITDAKTGKRRCKICREEYKATHVSTETCSAPGCGEPVVADGLCNRDYQRMRTRGNTDDPVRLTPEQREQSHKDAAARWYAKNQERLREESRERYQENREAELERRRAYTRDNPEKISEYNRRWTLENPGRRTELSRAWVQANPDAARANDATKRARRLGAMRETADGPVSYTAILAEHGMVCYLCTGEIGTRNDLHFDHVVPLSRGGTHTQDNIRPAHKRCNQRKSDKFLAEYLAELGGEAI